MDSFFFYDLETSGLDAREGRIMQFAGQRTDLDLNPVGDPINLLIKLSPDVLPSPEAILITGITPQQTLREGLTEAEFLEYFYKEVVKPNTTFLGYNTVRFDDEFMRSLHYRNFYDPYAWQWQNGCSRWDLLDVVRMTRALRPNGIEWPFKPDGKPTNTLETLTKANGLSHDKAHDALSDVQATIDVARLIKSKQPDLFEYLFKYRNKRAVKDLVLKGQPFVYATGRYSSEWLHTSVAVLLASHTEQEAALLYDLRFDPRPFMKMSVAELAEAWRYNPDPEAIKLPVKTMRYNRCPAVAPLGVVKDPDAQERINLTLETVAQNLAYLKVGKADFAGKIAQVVKQLDTEREQKRNQALAVDESAHQNIDGKIRDQLGVDGKIYDGFMSDADRANMVKLHQADTEELNNFGTIFKDARLKTLLPLYKARNYPKKLSSEERSSYEAYRQQKLFKGGENSIAAKYFAKLQQLAAEKTDKNSQYLLEELKLYGESILPDDVAQ